MKRNYSISAHIQFLSLGVSGDSHCSNLFFLIRDSWWGNKIFMEERAYMVLTGRFLTTSQALLRLKRITEGSSVGALLLRDTIIAAQS